VTWAWLWAGEQPSMNTLSGGLLVLGALVANELVRIFHARTAKICQRRNLFRRSI